MYASTVLIFAEHAVTQEILWIYSVPNLIEISRKFINWKQFNWRSYGTCDFHFPGHGTQAQRTQISQEIWKLWYTGCPRRNVPDFGRVFLMLKYTDITQNTYIQS